MTQVTKVMPNLAAATAKNMAGNKIIKRAALPAASGLAILAGASMNTPSTGPTGPHDPGSSVTDPLWDQIKHTGRQIENAGEEIGSAIKEGAENLLDNFLDFLDDIF